MSAKVLYDFNAEGGQELSIKEGEVLIIITKNAGDGWWMAKNDAGESGMVPEAYVEEVADYEHPPEDDSSFDEDDEWNTPFDQAPGNDQSNYPDATSGSPKAHPVPSSTNSEISNEHCQLKNTVGKDVNRFKTFVKVGVEDFILGNISKKCDKKLYTITDSNCDIVSVEWLNGPNYENKVQITNSNKKNKNYGLKKFVAYSIQGATNGNGTVERRYNQFNWLDHRLAEQFPSSIRPTLPEKQAQGNFEEEFVARRKTLLDKWLREICRHPILSRSDLLFGFISIDLQNEKEWKKFKRNQESTPYKIAGFWDAVTFPHESRFIEDGKAQIQKFSKFSKGLDSSISSLAAALQKSLNMHKSVQKDELRTLSISLGKLHKEFETSDQRKNAAQLAKAVENSTTTFNDASQLSSEWAQSTTIPLLDRLWIYSGMLSRVPALVETAEQTQDKIKSNQKKVGVGTPEARALESKVNTVNGVILSEADYFDQIRIPDFSIMLKNYLKSRADYHRQMMTMFEAAAAQFPEFDQSTYHS